MDGHEQKHFTNFVLTESSAAVFSKNVAFLKRKLILYFYPRETGTLYYVWKEEFQVLIKKILALLPLLHLAHNKSIFVITGFSPQEEGLRHHCPRYFVAFYPMLLGVLNGMKPSL